MGALIVVLGVAFFIDWWLAKDYSVVYLTTGEVYIGKLHHFFGMKLTDAYLLQMTKDSKDPEKSGFQLAPLKDALWSPKWLCLNDKQVIFHGLVSKTSRVAETLKNAVKQ